MTARLCKAVALRRPKAVALQRRGTVMIYVLGVLTLVALIGLILIARTHGESKRVAAEATASSTSAAVDGVIRVVQEALHRDIWGSAGNAAVPLSNLLAVGLQESNEPYDAPGPQDRWLALILPHLPVNESGTPVPPATGHTAPPWNVEHDVLAWHRVSYLGTDILQPAGTNAFAWSDNRRTPLTPGDATSYSDQPADTNAFTSSLQEVYILQTPAPHTFDANGNPKPLVPGSTTNVTIAEARAMWNAIDLPAFQALGQTRRFPYFDTNADGAVDLYDADGDGVPDSPISFVIPQDNADPNAPKTLYAAVRVIDHAGMLNVNAASSWRLTSNNDLTFDESTTDLQRRGRRVTELLLDEVAHADDTFLVRNRTAGLMDYRSGNDPVQYDRDVIRRALIGGWLSSTNYFLYGLGDEASLRRRGLLAPYDLAAFVKTANAADYRTIDLALRWSMLWTREVDSNTGSYQSAASRWSRLNGAYEPLGVPSPYEGYDGPANARGWRSLLQEDNPVAIRRPMVTTISHEVVPPPHGLALDASGTNVQGLSTLPVRFPLGNDSAQYFVMNWPVLSPSDPDPVIQNLPDWMRIQPIDLNMSVASNNAGVVEATKELYVRYMAAAIYRALEGVISYQGIPLTDGTPGDLRSLNRDYLAWQLALNMADFRDSDSEPTMLEWVYDPPTGRSRYLFGVEKQPFLTEAYAYLTAGDSSGPTGPGGSNQPGGGSVDQWFFAVEVFVPPFWNIPTSRLYLYSPGVSGPDTWPLAGFRLGGTGLTPTILSGGANGAYYVFCGSPVGAPADPLNPLNVASFYQNADFRIHTDGRGRVELLYLYLPPGQAGSDLGRHPLDVIDPAYSGGELAGNTGSGFGRWAARPPGIEPGQSAGFSLLRSTTGWRFTTAWQVFRPEGPGGSNPPGGVPFWRTLGLPNLPFSGLDDNVPEIVWPAQFTSAGEDPLHGGRPGFGSGLPFESFDSVAEISRMLLVGPLKYVAGMPVRVPNLFGFVGENLPATAFLAEILSTVPPPGDMPHRIAAGHIDFVNAGSVGGRPWTWRLFDYLTVQGHQYDGVDNDGDGVTDAGVPGAALDPAEGAKVLYRAAGRVNINTAPLPVLRSIPFLSLLPISSDFEEYANGGAAIPNPAGAYANDPTVFWDIASAIEARRERRYVPLRLADATGALQPVAVAAPWAYMGGPGGDNLPGPFTGIAELATLTHNHRASIVDALPVPNNRLFQLDRFYSGTGLPLYNHKVRADEPNLGDAPVGSERWSNLSPDYRYRRDNDAIDYAPILAPPLNASKPNDAAGIRGRDILLARLASLLTTRSDVFTAYVVFLDEDGNYVRRAQVTLDRSVCFREMPVDPNGPVARIPVLPQILLRMDTSYGDDMK